MQKKFMDWNRCLEMLKADVDCDHYERLAALFYYANYRFGKKIKVRMVNKTCFEVEAETFDDETTGRLLFEAEGFDYYERIIEVDTIRRFVEVKKEEKSDEACIITFNELSEDALKLAKTNNIRIVYFHSDEYEEGKEECLLFGSFYKRFVDLTVGFVCEDETVDLPIRNEFLSNKELLKVDNKYWPLELYIKNEAKQAKDKSEGKHCIRIAENSYLETQNGSIKLKWIDLNYEIKTSRKCYQIPVEWVYSLLCMVWDWDICIFEENKKEEVNRQLNILDIDSLKMEEISRMTTDKRN